MRPFTPTPGLWVLDIGYAITGNISLVRWAVREGRHTLKEATLKPGERERREELFIEGGRGDLYLLAFIEGEGEVAITSLQWLPWSRRWPTPP